MSKSLGSRPSSGSVSGMAGEVGMGVVGPVVVEDGPFRGPSNPG